MPGGWLGTCQPVLLMGGRQGGVGRAALHVPPVVAEAPPRGWGGRASQMEGLFIPLSGTHSAIRNCLEHMNFAPCCINTFRDVCHVNS